MCVLLCEVEYNVVVGVFIQMKSVKEGGKSGYTRRMKVFHLTLLCGFTKINTAAVKALFFCRVKVLHACMCGCRPQIYKLEFVKKERCLPILFSNWTLNVGFFILKIYFCTYATKNSKIHH